MLVKLKEDYTIPAGKVMRVYKSIGPVDEQQAVSDLEVGGCQGVTNFSMEYIEANPDLFEIISEQFDPV